VGALNVGTISLNFDKELSTNTLLKKNYEKLHIKNYDSKKNSSFSLYKEFPIQRKKNKKNRFSNMFPQSNKGISVKKGDEFGRFNMGSTIILVFEAGEGFKPDVIVGERVVYGQNIGHHYH
jgi:phosphatidylserine decarboxylase